jgi:hypothetical protein
MANIHITLQGKGGVGKSFVAAILAQYIAQRTGKPLCIDIDPVNATFNGYASLEVRPLQIMEDDEINSRKFDDMVELLAAQAAPVIIDSGASSFVPLSHYIISNQVPALLTEMGHQLVIHTVIAGGQSLLDTVSGFAHIASQFPEGTLFVVWINPFWGPIEHEGHEFEKMKAYLAYKERVSAIARIPQLKGETYGRDLSDMLKARLTFDEALALSSLTIMSRQRLKIIKGLLFNQLDGARVI